MIEKYLVIEVHDATPEFKSELNKIVLELDRIGIKKRSILVIPNHLGRNNILSDDGFLSWLSQLQGNGDEIVQHGYEHISTNNNYRSWSNRFVGERIAQGCGEFQNISYNEAQEKIQKGKEIFNQAGIVSKGFVAPGWLLNPESEKAIKDEGFVYTTMFRHIKFLLQQKTEKSEITNFASATSIYDVVNMGFYLYNKYLLNMRFKGKRRVARVAIHPKDLEHPKLFYSTLKAIEELKEKREITTCIDLASKLN